MRHFLNGIQIAPRNLDQIGVLSDFTDNPDFLRLNTDSVILPREAKEIIQNHIQNVGLFEGIPYQVELRSGLTIEYYADLVDGVVVRDHEVEVNLKKRKSIDNFFERAEGSSFDLLVKNGVEFDLVDVPYFVIKDNQFEQALQLAVVTFILGQQTYQQALVVGQAINQLVEASTPIPGLAPPGVPVVSFNVPAIIGASLNLVIQLIYFGLLLIAFIDLATQLFLVLFPVKRKLKACYFKELMTKTCQHFGYTFASDLLDAQPYWAVLPVPLIRDRESIWNILPDQLFPVFNNGWPGSSDTISSVLDLVRAMETMFNARTIVRGNEVRLERRDWLLNQTNLQLIPALSLQSERQDQYRYNTTDIWKRYYIHYQNDFQDLHTTDGETYDYHDAEFSTEPSFPVSNPDLVTIRGLQDVNIPFALGSRKDGLNWIELYAKLILQGIDGFTGILGGGTNFGAQIDDRKNALQISQTYFSVTKVLYGQTGAVSSGQLVQTEADQNILSATGLWDQYHQINEIQQNDYIIREDVRIRISSEEFLSLLDNNFALIDGVLCEILTLEWIDDRSFAKLSYKQPNPWAQGKVFTQTIN